MTTSFDYVAKTLELGQNLADQLEKRLFSENGLFPNRFQDPDPYPDVSFDKVLKKLSIQYRPILLFHEEKFHSKPDPETKKTYGIRRYYIESLNFCFSLKLEPIPCYYGYQKIPWFDIEAKKEGQVN